MSKVSVHTEFLDINWKLTGLISEIDRFDASWKGELPQRIEVIAEHRITGKERPYIITGIVFYLYRYFLFSPASSYGG